MAPARFHNFAKNRGSVFRSSTYWRRQWLSANRFSLQVTSFSNQKASGPRQTGGIGKLGPANERHRINPMPVEILLVEDNYPDVWLFKEIVSHSSVAVRITVAEDAEKALELLADPLFKPDLIITDVNLSKISGLELVRQFTGNGIPVVVFSSSNDPTNKAEALKLGAKEFVQKPADLDGYTEAVRKILLTWAQPPP